MLFFLFRALPLFFFVLHHFIHYLLLLPSFSSFFLLFHSFLPLLYRSTLIPLTSLPCSSSSFGPFSSSSSSYTTSSFITSPSVSPTFPPSLPPIVLKPITRNSLNLEPTARRATLVCQLKPSNRTPTPAGFFPRFSQMLLSLESETCGAGKCCWKRFTTLFL